MTPREEIELMIMSYRLLTGIVLTTLIAWTATALSWALARRRRSSPRAPTKSLSWSPDWTTGLGYDQGPRSNYQSDGLEPRSHQGHQP